MTKVTFGGRTVPFTEKDEGGYCSADYNRITVEVMVDGEVVWTKTASTDDTIESVCTVREMLFSEALDYARKEHGYEPDEDDFEAAGYLVYPAA